MILHHAKNCVSDHEMVYVTRELDNVEAASTVTNVVEHEI